MKSGIYEILHIDSGKRYIGSATNLNLRKNTHFHGLRNNKHPNRILQSAWNLHGESKFSFNVVCLCEENDLITREQSLIDEYLFLKKPLYNIRKIAMSNLGFRHSSESKKKMSLSRTGIKNYAFGKKRPPELVARIAKALKGRKVPNKGVPMSPEQKEKLRKYRTGRKTGPMSDVVKEKISQSRMGIIPWNKGMKRVTRNLYLPPDEALLWINKRAEDRKLRGVQATYQK